MVVYIRPFAIPASIPAFFYLFGPAGPFASVALLLLFLIGAEWVSPRGAVPAVRRASRRFRLLPTFYVLLQLGQIAWALAQTPHVSLLGFPALLLATGVATGVFGVLAARMSWCAAEAALASRWARSC